MAGELSRRSAFGGLFRSWYFIGGRYWYEPQIVGFWSVISPRWSIRLMCVGFHERRRAAARRGARAQGEEPPERRTCIALVVFPAPPWCSMYDVGAWRPARICTCMVQVPAAPGGGRTWDPLPSRPSRTAAAARRRGGDVPWLYVLAQRTRWMFDIRPQKRRPGRHRRYALRLTWVGSHAPAVPATISAIIEEKHGECQRDARSDWFCASTSRCPVFPQ